MDIVLTQRTDNAFTLQLTSGGTGPAGVGVPAGGSTGQILVKNSGTNYDTGWATKTPDSTLLNRANHTGTQAAATISDFSEALMDFLGGVTTAGQGLIGAGSVSLAYDDANNKITITGASTSLDVEAMMDYLGGVTVGGKGLLGTGLIGVTYDDANDKITISTGATANSSDATLLNRANHTGTQLSTTISDFNAAVLARSTALFGGDPLLINTPDDGHFLRNNGTNWVNVLGVAMDDVTGAAPVAYSNDFNDLDNRPVLPTQFIYETGAGYDARLDTSLYPYAEYSGPNIPPSDSLDDRDIWHKTPLVFAAP